MSHCGGLGAIAVSALLAGALVNGSPAWAQTAAPERLAGEIAACRMVEDPTERLRCYDAAADADAEAGVVDDGRVVLELAGEDDFDSDSFVSPSPWHLRWETEGSIFTVELRDMAGELIGIIGNQIGRGEDRSPVQAPGEYMLAVRAIGAWQLWVMEED